jgi:ABC-type transport system involved in multi-copper enzyme maturation permease subunit
MNNILTFTNLTIREVTRRKMALVALILGLAFLLIFNVGFFFIFQELRSNLNQAGVESAIMNAKQVQREVANFLLMSGLYTINFLATVMATLVSADTLSGEIQSGTIQTLVSKPVHRAEVVLGKWLGFALLLAAYIVLMAGGTILGVWVQAGYLPPHILAGIALIYLGILIVLSLSVASSSMFSTLATGGVVLGLYGLAFIGSWVEQIGSYLRNEIALQIGILTSLLMPSEALWRRASFEMTSPLVRMTTGSPFTSASVPSPLMIGYAVIYLVIILFVGLRIFQKRDL